MQVFRRILLVSFCLTSAFASQMQQESSFWTPSLVDSETASQNENRLKIDLSRLPLRNGLENKKNFQLQLGISVDIWREETSAPSPLYRFHIIAPSSLEKERVIAIEEEIRNLLSCLDN